MNDWTTDLETGVPEIDAQHRELFVQIARLGEAVRDGRLVQAKDTLEYLRRYTREPSSFTVLRTVHET